MVNNKGETILFNMIVTHIPGYPMRRETIMQLRWILDRVDVLGYEHNKLYLRVTDPREAVDQIRNNIPEKTPILKVVPVDAVVEPSLEHVINKVQDLVGKTPEGTIAVKVDGYLEHKGRLMHRPEAASEIGAALNRRVNLRNPDVLVYIKVTRYRGRYVAAIYVGPPTGILSIVKERRDRKTEE